MASKKQTILLDFYPILHAEFLSEKNVTNTQVVPVKIIRFSWVWIILNKNFAYWIVNIYSSYKIYKFQDISLGKLQYLKM